ncbi:MAG: hypothetical protein WAV32_00860 [Halobacteriota archaeon]
MLLWFLFIVVSFLLGLSISTLLDIRFFVLERAFFSIVLGHAISIWLIFILACLSGSGTLSTVIILLCIVICALLSAICRLIATHKNHSDNILKFDKYTLIFFAFILLYLLFMNLYGVLRPDAAGNLYAFHTVWADYPFHTSIITGFVYGGRVTFPPAYPQFLHTEMHYPFLMDFYSAVLMKAGLVLRGAIIIPNILFQSALFGLLFFLAYRLTGLKRVGALAVVIFIFSGYPSSYLMEHLLPQFAFAFLNPMYAVIMPQRTAILGMAISFAVYILLYEALFSAEACSGNKPEVMYKELFLAGTLVGLLPYIHAHSFMATAFVSLSLVLTTIATYKNRAPTCKLPGKSDLKNFAILFTPLILLSLPQIFFIQTGITANFFLLFPGWTEANSKLILGFDWSLSGAFFSFAKSIFLVLKLWLINLGILFFLLPLGFFKTTRSVRAFYLPFGGLFVIANIVKFQPWYFDNYKLFLHWYALTVILVAVAIFWLSDYVRARKRDVGTLLLAALVCGCILGGVGSHVEMSAKECRMWSGGEIGVANWVRENTAPDSVFLTGSAHNQPISSLSGRLRVMGYEGWLWSHGINWTSICERKGDEIEMYTGNYTLVKEYGVDYVCVGPYESAFATDNHFAINYSAFEDETRFCLKYDKVIGEGEGEERWRIYEVMPGNPG